MYTIQQAAHEILKQAGTSLKSVEVARRILEQQLIVSSAKNPIQSISQALERNIRMNKGNTPALQFIDSIYGREVDIVNREATSPVLQTTNYLAKNVEVLQPVESPSLKEEVSLQISKSIIDKVKIYQLGKGIETLDEALEQLLRSGLSAQSSALLEVIKKEMESL